MSESNYKAIKQSTVLLAALLGFLYGLSIALPAVLFTGAGHGWSSGLITCLAVILIPLASCAWVYRGTRQSRTLAILPFVSALAIDVYLIVATNQEGWEYLERVRSIIPVIFSVWLTLWFAWQIPLVPLVFRQKK